jgi:hypothetical protein
MKKVFLAAMLVATFALAACAEFDSGDQIPEPFKTKIAQLRSDSLAMQRKCADLQKQIAEMNAQAQWDAQQMNVAGGEALSVTGRDPRDWYVNVNTLRIESTKSHY